jgi:4a-hydroxytetrahydrobiopterin dehydratase
MEWLERNNKLVKTFEMRNFSELINCLGKLALIADKIDHHPDFHVYEYNKISFELTTHDQGTVTEKDITLSKEIDNLFLR